MTDAPERIWTCRHLGEYGNYYPEAVEAEGECGGEAVEYIHADIVEELIHALEGYIEAQNAGYPSILDMQSEIYAAEIEVFAALSKARGEQE